MPSPLLRLTDINKSFLGTHARTDISLEVDAGKVLCLLGDNGAGKSTLIKILSGFDAREGRRQHPGRVRTG